jgi:hypothetical protein
VVLIVQQDAILQSKALVNLLLMLAISMLESAEAMNKMVDQSLFWAVQL